MARKFCITEEQYKMLIKEGVAIDNNKVNIQAKSADDNSLNAAVDDAVKAGADKNKINVVAPLESSNGSISSDKKKDSSIVYSPSSTNECRIITKQQLQENRLKTLKKNSEIYTVKEFINKFNLK